METGASGRTPLSNRQGLLAMMWRGRRKTLRVFASGATASAEASAFAQTSFGGRVGARSRRILLMQGQDELKCRTEPLIGRSRHPAP
jgi:hypothetical protein